MSSIRVQVSMPHFIDDTGIVNTAKRGQGHGDYPGVDDWFAVEITFGMVVLGGLPGQSAFYSIIETYNKVEATKKYTGNCFR